MSDVFKGPQVLLNGATAAATSEVADSFTYPGTKSIQASVDGTGAVTATVVIDVSNDGVHWILAVATITLSGTSTDSDGFLLDAPWTYVRARLTAITGTSAAAYVSIASAN